MISIVVPVLNEEESLEVFYKELLKSVPALDKQYEIIFVDDGSTDGSLEILKKLVKNSNCVKVFSFRRNLGKAEALTYGFARAAGEYVITLDADLQDKPSEIQKLLKKCREGTEVVCGNRINQKRAGYMIFISGIFNRMLNLFFDLKIHDYNCGLKVYTREAAKSLQLYGGLHRFIPLLAYQQGFTIGEMDVEHDVRKLGKSKYGFSKIWKDLPDMFTIMFLAKYSKRPLHFFGFIGLILILIGIGILGYLTVIHFMGQSISRRPVIYYGMLFVIAGLQTLFTGFLADLMLHISQSPQLLDEKNLHFPVKYSSEKNHD